MATIQSTFGRPPIRIQADATASDAARQMAEHGVGALVVTAAGADVGLIDERDLIRKVLVSCRDACATRVSEVMSTGLPSVKPTEDAKRCSELMRTEGTRYLLVREVAGDLVGVVSMRDVIRALLGERDAEVKQLTSYVTGSFG